MACGSHKVNATHWLHYKRYWVQMQGGDSPTGEAVVLDFQITPVLLLLLTPLPHCHCPPHSTSTLGTSLKYWGFERTWAKAQCKGSGLPNQLSFWISVPPLIGWVTLVKLVHLSEPHFHHLWGGENNIWGLKETMYTEYKADLQLPWSPFPIISKIGCDSIASFLFV